MIPIFRHELGRLRGQIIGWGASFALLGWITVFSYNALVGSGSAIQQLMDSYPKELMAFFGNPADMFSGPGYLDLAVLSYSLVILGFFSVLAGGGLLAGDEEAGRLDLIQAYPVSRTALFAGRVLALLTATGAILACFWLGCILGLPGSKLEATPGSLILPFLSLFAEMMLFAGLACWLGMVLPSRGMAVMTAGILLVASYFVTSLARIVDTLKDIARASPYGIYQSAYAIDGLNTTWFVELLAIAGLLFLAAWWSYLRRDLRVSGEGSWRRSFAFRRKLPKPQ
jgi:ABC-2 type transport system permease protein